jgi:hypothetical protein
VTSLLPGLGADLQTALGKEIQQLRASFVPAGSANPDSVVNGNATARKVLVSVVIDYLGDGELKEWAKENSLPI